MPKSREPTRLTAKQKRFIDEYLIDLNATQAAIRSGYSEKTAEAIGFENLRKPKIEAEVRRRMKDREKRTEVTQDRVLKELAKIAFSDIKDFLEFKTAETKIGENDDGDPIIDYQTIINLKDSADVDGSLISEVQLKDGTLKFKLHDKMAALDKIGKHLGMFTDKVEVKGNINNPFEGMTTEQLLKLAGEDDEFEEQS